MISKICQAGLCAGLAAGLALVALQSTGCKPGGGADPSPAPASAARLKLLIVDDPAMASAVRQLRAEWEARSQGTSQNTFEVDELTEAELVSLDAVAADAVIYPSGRLGLLAERGLIAPVSKHLLTRTGFKTHSGEMRGATAGLPSSVFPHPALLDEPAVAPERGFETASSEEIAWREIFEDLRLGESAWGGATYGVPFGSPVLTVLYRVDLFEKFARHPPRTWSEYAELVQFFSDRRNLNDAAPAAEVAWHGTLEPLADGWAARTLLARAAAYAKHRDNYSALFDVNTMEPLIASAAFVRALEELVAAAQSDGAQSHGTQSNEVQSKEAQSSEAKASDAQTSGAQSAEAQLPSAQSSGAKSADADSRGYDPAQVREEFFAGRAAMALTWPVGARAADGAASQAPALKVGFAELPGAEAVYGLSDGRWEKLPRDRPARVPLLAIAGRIGSVSAQSSRPEAAFQLLAWLSGPKWGTRVSSASSATTLYRASQVRKPEEWVERSIEPDAARGYARAVEQSLSRETWISLPRMPGQEKYLAALDRAVSQAVHEGRPAAEALKEAAAAWTEITARLGLDTQRRAYARCVGQEQ